MISTTVVVLGGDLRQCYLAGYMDTCGHDVTCYGTMPLPFHGNHFISEANSLEAAVKDARLIICPAPFSRDGVSLTASPDCPAISARELLALLTPGQLVAGGMLPDSFLLGCSQKQITPLDFMKEEALALANAALTAEGLLASLIRQSPFSLTGRRLLLLGYGRCGQEIGRLLRYFELKLSVYDRDPHRLDAARMDGILGIVPENFPTLSMNYDIIINTVPVSVLTPLQLRQLPKHCILFDIASAPYGFDENLTREFSLSLVRCPGIPGKMMPQTAGELIGKVVSERMLSHGI